MTVPSIREAAREQAQYVEDSAYSVVVIADQNTLRVSLYDSMAQTNPNLSTQQTHQYFQEYYHLLNHGVDVSTAELAAAREIVNQLEKDPAVDL